MANNWRGCKNVFMQGHGDWADPDIYIENEDGLFVFNYWDIEDALWNDFLESEGIEEKDTYDKRGNISKAWENKFSKYCRNNAYDYITYDLLPEYGYFSDEMCSKDGKFCSWHIDDVKEYDAEQEEDEDDDDFDYDEDDFDYDDIEESCGKKAKKKNKSKIVESAGSSNVKINADDYNTLYTDIEGVFGEPGVTVSLGEMKEYWNDANDSDPVLSDYDSYDEWFEDTIQLLEPLQESVSSNKKNLSEAWSSDDLRSAVYNALSDVCFEFLENGRHPSEKEMDLAIEWWQTHFWDSDDAPEKISENKLFMPTNMTPYAPEWYDQDDNPMAIEYRDIVEMWDDDDYLKSQYSKFENYLATFKEL